MNFLATFVAFYLVDHYGRRTLLILGGVSTTISLPTHVAAPTLSTLSLLQVMMAVCMTSLTVLGGLYASPKTCPPLAPANSSSSAALDPFYATTSCSTDDVTINSELVGYVATCKLSCHPIYSHTECCSYLCIVSIYIYVVGFAFSWGPVCWLLPTEIFPLTQRARWIHCLSIDDSSNWYMLLLPLSCHR